MTKAKIRIEVEETDGTIIPLGDIVAGSTNSAKLKARERIRQRKRDLPPTGQVRFEAAGDGSLTLAIEGKPTVNEILKNSQLLS